MLGFKCVAIHVSRHFNIVRYLIIIVNFISILIFRLLFPFLLAASVALLSRRKLL
jgi:hypothetical protein